MSAMDEAAATGVILRLIRAEESGKFDPAPVFLGPYTAFMTVSALQLAWRHPDLTPPLKQVIEQVGREIQGLLRGPAGKLLEAGWDPSRDVPRDAP